MDQYLQWDSHHHLSAKYSVISTLTNRVKTVCSNPELLQKEMEHLIKALTNCKYSKWALDKVDKRLAKSASEVKDGANSQGSTGAQPTTNEVQTKGKLYHIPRVSAKALKRSVGGMVYRPTSKAVAPSNPTGLPQGYRSHGQQKWGQILVPVWLLYLW